MKLAYKLDSLDGVDDALKPLYAKEGDKFVLQVDDTGAKTAIQKEREARAAAEKELQGLKEADAQRQREADEAKAKATGDFDKLKAQVEADKKAALDERDKATAGLKSYLLKAELTAAIAQHKGNPHLSKLVEDQFEAVLSPDGAHKVVVKGDPSKTPAQFIEYLKADASYGAFFEGSGVSGGGAPPAGGKPAGGATTMTRTQFTQLSPADQLAKAKAGVQLTD